MSNYPYETVPIAIRPHTAEQCAGPTVINPSTGRKDPRYFDLCVQLWRDMSPTERNDFHRAACLNYVDAGTRAVIVKVVEAVKAYDTANPTTP